MLPWIWKLFRIIGFLKSELHCVCADSRHLEVSLNCACTGNYNGEARFFKNNNNVHYPISVDSHCISPYQLIIKCSVWYILSSHPHHVCWVIMDEWKLAFHCHCWTQRTQNNLITETKTDKIFEDISPKKTHK